MLRVKEYVRVHVRWAIRRDVPEVVAIEAASFARPWAEEEVLRALAKRDCIGLVAEHDDRIAGYAIYQLFPDRIEVLNFAVAPAYRRRGVGGQMVAKLTAKLSVGRRTAVELTVRESNLVAQLFWKHQGFWCEGVVTGHYEDEDGYDFAYRLPEGTL